MIYCSHFARQLGFVSSLSPLPHRNSKARSFSAQPPYPCVGGTQHVSPWSNLKLSQVQFNWYEHWEVTGRNFERYDIIDIPTLKKQIMCSGPFPSAKNSLGDCRRDSAAGQKLTGPPGRQIIWKPWPQQLAASCWGIQRIWCIWWQPPTSRFADVGERLWFNELYRFRWSCSVWTGQRSWTFPGPLPISVCCRIAPCCDKDRMCVEGRYGKCNRPKSLFGKTSPTPGMIAITARFCLLVAEYSGPPNISEYP